MSGIIAQAAGIAPNAAAGNGLVAGAMRPQWATKLDEFQASEWAPTPLADEERAPFQQWLFNTGLFKSIKTSIAKENGIKPDQIDDERVAQMLMQSGDYDYVGAWKDGMREEISPHDGMPHWGSRASDGRWLKSPRHETAWKELFMEQYRIDPDEMGLNSLDKAIEWSKTQQLQNP